MPTDHEGPTLRRLLRPILILAFLAGCGGKSTPDAPTPLRVAAASDLQAAFPVLASRFKLDRGGNVEPVFDDSGLLAEQIKQGAPFDLFLSANSKYVDDLAADGAIDRDSVRPYATGSTSPGDLRGVRREDLQTLDDLKMAGIKKIAIANPDDRPLWGRGPPGTPEGGALGNALQPKIVWGEQRSARRFIIRRIWKRRGRDRRPDRSPT